jgi:hypothetical protein
MTHPCDAHPCDHCYTCDVEGVCCQTVAGQAASIRATRPDSLRAAIARDAPVVPSLRELVRQEDEARSLPAAVRVGLLSAALSDAFLKTPRKDAAYVVPSRPNQ